MKIICKVCDEVIEYEVNAPGEIIECSVCCTNNILPDINNYGNLQKSIIYQYHFYKNRLEEYEKAMNKTHRNFSRTVANREINIYRQIYSWLDTIMDENNFDKTPDYWSENCGRSIDLPTYCQTHKRICTGCGDC